ncbi:MAG: dihydrodipicolinate synthase family protein [Acidimicrobiia bacterium]
MLPPPEYMPALITPFTRGGEIDIDAHTSNLRVLASVGINGFVVGGSNGEGPYLEPGERHLLVRAGRRRKAHFMVGIAAESTRIALKQLEEAIDADADSVLVLTPTTLSRGRDDAVLRFYRTIADASSLPVFLYSVPGVTAYSMPVGLVSKLSRHENIVGMKDSSGDVVRLQSIIDAAPAEFILYSGSSRALTAAMAIGCHGAITGSGNYVPELVLQTLAAAKESPEHARRLQKRLSAISADVEAHGVPGVKAASKAAGLDPGHPREPLARLSRGVETSIAKLI